MTIDKITILIIRNSKNSVFLLDYDGTLAPYTKNSCPKHCPIKKH